MRNPWLSSLVPSDRSGPTNLSRYDILPYFWLIFAVLWLIFGLFFFVIKTPLWLGIYLKQRNLCRIIPPDFLNVDSLSMILEEEKRNMEVLSNLMGSSHYYFEICHTLLRQYRKMVFLRENFKNKRFRWSGEPRKNQGSTGGYWNHSGSENTGFA